MQYPIGEHAAEWLTAASGRKLADITLEAAAAGELSPGDTQISAETLRAQAGIARQAGYPQLAANLLRAAELVAVPNEELLRMYEMLRPRRSTGAELAGLAEALERRYAAPETAAFVREAAAAYRERDLLRRDPPQGDPP